jgi:hypothetical protein
MKEMDQWEFQPPPLFDELHCEVRVVLLWCRSIPIHQSLVFHGMIDISFFEQKTRNYCDGPLKHLNTGAGSVPTKLHSVCAFECCASISAQ